MIRELGFAGVYEVAFGADLVARAFAKLLARDDGGRYIATPCPAVVSYVRKYHPDLTPSLAPIVSPMVAMARVHAEQSTSPVPPTAGVVPHVHPVGGVIEENVVLVGVC
jgi:iron only hydrogenase large subunit-like protein